MKYYIINSNFPPSPNLELELIQRNVYLATEGWRGEEVASQDRTHSAGWVV